MRIFGYNSFSRINYFPLTPILNSLPVNAVLIAIVFIAGLTLFPFDFYLPYNSTTALDKIYLFKWGGLSDLLNVVVNVFLFVPLGFSLAWLPRIRTAGELNPRMAILFLGFLLSLTIETLQLFLPSRYVSIIDILANTMGAVLGLEIFRHFGPSILARAYNLLIRSRSLFKPGIISIALAGYFFLMLVISVNLQGSSSLTNWDEDLPLVVGYGTKEGRSWEGTVHSLSFANQALFPRDIEKMETRTGEPGQPWICTYHLGPAESRYQDEMGNLPDLIWQTSSESKVSTGSHILQAGTRLQTSSSPTRLIRAIKSASQFTLRAVLETADLQQGLAQIISLPRDMNSGNLVLAQDKRDMVIQLRAAAIGNNGYSPKLIIPDVFENREPVDLVVTFDGETLMAFVNDKQLEPSLKLSPGAAMILNFLDRNLNEIHGFHVIYYGLFFAPLGLLFFMFVRQLRHYAYLPLFVAITAIFVIPLFLELYLAETSNRPFYADNLLLSVIFAVLPIPLLSSWTIEQPARPARNKES